MGERSRDSRCVVPLGHVVHLGLVLKGIRHQSTGHTRLGIFARGVDIQNNNLVAELLQFVGELVLHQASARVQVRLEYRDESAVSNHRPSRLKRSRHLGGMVGEVVIDFYAAHLAVQLKATLGATKPRNRLQCLGGIVSQANQHREGAGGIDGVVLAGNTEFCRPGISGHL
ncbi:MAG: hypothetical protein RLZZ603_1128 [Actinomycetota bacterium]